MCLTILRKLHTSYPTVPLATHISTATDAIDIWGMTDNELLHSLEKYSLEMEAYGSPVYKEESLSKIIEEGMHLDTILEEEEED